MAEGIRGTAGNMWSKYGTDIPLQEGWDLFWRSDGELEIEAVDVDDPETPVLDSDDEALQLVIRKASLGSRPHLLALYLEGRIHSKECWVPRELIGIEGEI